MSDQPELSAEEYEQRRSERISAASKDTQIAALKAVARAQHDLIHTMCEFIELNQFEGFVDEISFARVRDNMEIRAGIVFRARAAAGLEPEVSLANQNTM